MSIETAKKSISSPVTREEARLPEIGSGSVMPCHAFTREGMLLLAAGELVISDEQAKRLMRGDVVFSDRPPKPMAQLLLERHRAFSLRGAGLLEEAEEGDAGAGEAGEEVVTFAEEIGTARAVRRAAIRQLEELVEQAEGGGPLDLRSARRTMGELADSMRRNERALVSLIRLNRLDSYTFTHSINTCILSVLLARRCRMRGSVERFALGALVHDIGKVFLPIELLRKGAHLTREEWELVRKHPLFGVEIVEQSEAAEECDLEAIAQHHERVNGSGYPGGLRAAEFGLTGRIVAIADVFDALTSDRPFRRRMRPPEAMEEIVKGAGELYDLSLTRLFVGAVGVFPVGSLVRLSGGELAVVVAANPRAVRRPVILIVADSGGEQLSDPDMKDLSGLAEGEGEWEIVGTADPFDFGIDIDEYLAKAPEISRP